MANGFGMAGFSNGLLSGLQAVDNLYGNYVRRQQTNQELDIQRQNSDRVSRYYDALAKNQEFDNDIKQREEQRNEDKYNLAKNQLTRAEKLPIFLNRIDEIAAGAPVTDQDKAMAKLYNLDLDNPGGYDYATSLKQNPGLLDTDEELRAKVASAWGGAGLTKLGDNQYRLDLPDGATGAPRVFSRDQLLSRPMALGRISSKLANAMKSSAMVASGGEMPKPPTAKEQYDTETSRYKMLEQREKVIQAQLESATGPKKAELERQLKQTQIDLNQERAVTEQSQQGYLDARTDNVGKTGLGAVGRTGGKSGYSADRAIKMAQQLYPAPAMPQGDTLMPEEKAKLEAQTNEQRAKQNDYINRVRGLITIGGMDQAGAESAAQGEFTMKSTKDGRVFWMVKTPDPASGKMVFVPFAQVR